jgi:hypothetical protein
MKSIHDKLSKLEAKLNRKAVNINTQLNGTEIDLIRIKKYSPEAWAGQNYDVFGHSQKRPVFDVIGNCLLKYPTNSFDLFNVLDDNYEIRSTSFDINDILPVKLTIRFKGEYLDDPIRLMTGDILIDIKLDENENKIPIILEVKKVEGEFRGKYLIKRKADLSLVRGNLSKELKNYIKEYIANFNESSNKS